MHRSRHLSTSPISFEHSRRRIQGDRRGHTGPYDHRSALRAWLGSNFATPARRWRWLRSLKSSTTELTCLPFMEGKPHASRVEALPRSRRDALWFGFFRSGMQTAMECLAALHKRSHETHAADNAFVAGMEEPRVPPQHAGVGDVGMQRVAGMRRGRRRSIDWPCRASPCSRCLNTTDGRLARTDPPLDGDAPEGSCWRYASKSPGPAWLREARGRRPCGPKNGVRTAMGTRDHSGFDLSMGYDGELTSMAYGSLPTHVYSRRSSEAVQLSPPSVAKS